MKVLLLASLLIVSGVALLPEASAECEPNPITDPDFCEGWLPPVPPECWSDEHGIHCRF